jgi:hypothetical protein
MWTSLKQPTGPSYEQPAESPYPQPRRAPGNGLSIELIPRSMHYKNARAVVPKDVWGLLRSICLKLDGRRCSECGSTENLECHEEWEFRLSPTRVMKLTRLRALCHLCHMLKHIGLAKSSDEFPFVKKHAMERLGLSQEQLAQRERLAYKGVRMLEEGGMFALDLTYLNGPCFVWVHHRFRKFVENEIQNCRQTVAVDNRSVQRRRALHNG